LLLALTRSGYKADPGFGLLAAAVIREHPGVTEQALKDEARALIEQLGRALDPTYLPLLSWVGSPFAMTLNCSFNDHRDPVLNEALALTGYLCKAAQGGTVTSWPAMGNLYQAWKEEAPISPLRWLVSGVLLGWVQTLLEREAREARKPAGLARTFMQRFS